MRIVVALLIAVSINQQAIVQARAVVRSGMTQAPEPARRAMPASVANTGERGEDVYDAAKAGDWRTAGVRLAALKQAAAAIRTDVPNAVTDEQALQSAITALSMAVSKRNRNEATRQANRITLIAADLSARFQSAVPADITRLDYHGRQLEILIAAGELAQLKTTVDNLRATWSRVRPAVMSHRGTTAAARFDATLTHLEAAKTLAEYRRAAEAELNEVDNLERVFSR